MCVNIQLGHTESTRYPFLALDAPCMKHFKCPCPVLPFFFSFLSVTCQLGISVLVWSIIMRNAAVSLGSTSRETTGPSSRVQSHRWTEVHNWQRDRLKRARPESIKDLRKREQPSRTLLHLPYLSFECIPTIGLLMFRSSLN